MLVDMVIKSSAIFVKGRALKNWIQVEGIDPEILEIIQFIENPLKVPAITPQLSMDIKAAAILFPRLKLIPVRRPWAGFPVSRN